MISHLALYDIVHTPGVAADISHICTPAAVSGHLGPDKLREAVEGCTVVVIPAGVPRKPGKKSFCCVWLLAAVCVCFDFAA